MLNFRPFSRAVKPDLAIDLGTANTRIIIPNEGVVFDEPSLCCYSNDNGRFQFVRAGHSVLEMVDRAPRGLTVRSPLRRGVLQDIESGSALLRHGLSTVMGRRRRFRPSALIGIPADATKAEANALLATAHDAGLGRVELVREPFAAAIGAGLPVREAHGSMIIECGAGTTEIAVFSISGDCQTRSVRVGSLGLDEALSDFLHTKHHFLIGRLTAERLKRTLLTDTVADTVDIGGRCIHSRLPAMLALPTSEFDPVLHKHFAQLADAAHHVIGTISPDLAADLLSKPIVATGGGACMGMLADAVMERCGLPMVVAKDAEGCVARGLANLLLC